MFPPIPDAKIYYTLDGRPAGPPLEHPVEIVWFDDALPYGAQAVQDDGHSWLWVRSGSNWLGLAHKSPPDQGTRFHYLYGAQYPLRVMEDDQLFTYVRLHPDRPPREIMLEWYDGSNEHRAYWGEDLIHRGRPGTPGHVFMGPLPPVGQWVRLVVPAEAVGLGPDRPITGMRFYAYGGEVWWDRSGKLTAHPGLQRLYTEPISLKQPTVLQAVAVAPGMAPSPPVYRFYSVDFSTSLPVVCLAMDPELLFNAVSGMYVFGTNANPNVPYYRANFWRDWERKAQLLVVETNGTEAVNIGIGVQMQGGWSRAIPQKSLSLRARKRYGPAWILWNAFPELPLCGYDSLVLRNSGNDWKYARFRDGFLQSLMQGSSLDIQAFRPVHLFLNDQYWGILNLRERFDKDYLRTHHPYLAAPGVDIIKDDIIVAEGDIYAWESFCRFLDNHSMEDPANFAALTNQIVLENFLDWVAVEIICDNRDWPDHNIRCWRPRTETGRWRWLLTDLDSTFSMKDPGPARDTLQTILQSKPSGRFRGRTSLLFRRILENPVGRDAFLTQICELLATRFYPSNVLAHLDRWVQLLKPEMPRQIERWRDYGTKDWPALPDLETWLGYVDQIRQFVQQRPAFVRQHLIEHFQLPGTIEVRLEARNPRLGRIRFCRTWLNNSDLPWQRTWLATVPMTVEAVAYPGARFAGWEGHPDWPARVTLRPEGEVHLVARFEPDPEYDPQQLSPVPYPLRYGDYVLDRFDAKTPPGTYPPGMQFLQCQIPDPTLEIEMDSLWTGPYDLDSRSRFVGLDELGIGFINTRHTQGTPNAGYVGEVRLSLDTTGVTNITVQWTGGTVLPNQRPYAIRLQYRIGDQEPFQDVIGPDGLPVEYQSSVAAGDEKVFGPVALPPETANQPLVQLRWRYYFRPPGFDGPRAFLRLDDILIHGERLPTPIQIRSLALQNRLFSVQLEANPASEIQIETSTDLQHWKPIQTLKTDRHGLAQWVYPIETERARFFRFRYGDESNGI